MTKNMTEGSPLKLILQFSLPLFFGSLFQQLYSVVDSMVVGRYLGPQALAAIGATGSLFYLIIGFCQGVCQGLTIPIAQKFGANDTKTMRNYFYTGIVITLVLGFVTALLTSIFCVPIMKMIHTPEDVFDQSYIYLLIHFIGIPCTLIYNLLASALRSVGNSKSPFYVLIVASFVNIVLDIVFVCVFRWGVAGAAIATLTAQAISGLLLIIVIIKNCNELKIQKQDMYIKAKKVKTLLSIGLPMGLQTSITAIGTIVTSTATNTLGSIYVTAFTTASRIRCPLYTPVDCIALAVSTFASQNLGAGKPDRIKKAVNSGIAICFGYLILVGLILYFFGKYLTLLFIDSSQIEIIEIIGYTLNCYAVLSWPIAFLNISRLVTQGLGYSRRAIWSGVLEMIARVSVACFVVPVLGYKAICFNDQAAWILATAYIVPMSIHCIKQVSKEHDS